MNYRSFLEQKKIIFHSQGKPVNKTDAHSLLFPFQRDFVYWSARKGKAAIFADCGLGKTFMQLEWARLIGEPTLIIAPLAVGRQTVKEAAKIGIEVEYLREHRKDMPRIAITNYEMVEHFEPERFGAVVLDESSILKSIDGKTRKLLTQMFAQTPYKLCCTATPAPNDIAEIANHAEFLGVASRQEMLAMFFVHDNEGWRLKRHAVEPFYEWLASWSMSLSKPSDLGYDDNGFVLPPLTLNPIFFRSNIQAEGELFASTLKGIGDRARVRSEITDARLAELVPLIHGDDQWLIWCNLNKEGQLLRQTLKGAREIKGDDSVESKIQNIQDFQDGKYRILITKPSICGFGLNLQNCHNIAFFGLSDSWESFYQAIRRAWRFGQTEPVTAHILLADIEKVIYDNVMGKNAEADKLKQGLIQNLAQFEKAEVSTIGLTSSWEYQTMDIKTDRYHIMLGDSCERMKEMESDSIHLSVFSPPFAALYTYSSTERDLGNCKTEAEFMGHFRFIIQELLRVTMPGRICAVHVFDIPAMLVRDGYIGIKDFSGDVIREFQKCGWIYDARIPIDKNQQAQSIRTHSKALTMSQLEKDRSWLRPALPDYILKFRKAGDNAAPVVNGEITRDLWIEYASPSWPDPIPQDRCGQVGAFPTWYGIRETDTLQGWRGAGNHRNVGGNDEKHICPLQLETISRIIKLWSNKYERVFTPFMGIGSEVYQAVSLERYGIGIELKQEYFSLAAEYVAELVRESELFASVVG